MFVANKLLGGTFCSEPESKDKGLTKLHFRSLPKHLGSRDSCNPTYQSHGKKKSHAFHDTGCLIGILIMV